MNMSGQSILITTKQLQYLRGADFLPASLMRVIEAAQPVRGDSCSLTMPREVAEEFRSAFTDRLAASGFDASYNPNDEGTILEGLIDCFYHP
jgi:hypothetical protein